MSIELKIKSKHLALEAGVIRFEEQKLKKQLTWYAKRQLIYGSPISATLNSLVRHRKWNVRNENRATFLARAYIAGKPYKTVERSVKDFRLLEYYIVPRVLSMVCKYHKYNTKREDILAWIKE